MKEKKRLIYRMTLALMGIIFVLHPLPVQGAENAATLIAEAKTAIEQARQAGAEKAAPADIAQARSWLAQAEKEYEASQSVLSRTMKMVLSDQARTQEILYLADMARTRGRIAEAKAKKAAVTAELKDVKKDLTDFQTSLEVMNKKFAEAEKAKGVQAQAEAQLKELVQAKQEVAALEQQKKKELEEAQKKQAELDALKRKELEEVQKKQLELDAMKRKELEQARLQEAKQASEKERLASLKEKEAAELKAKETLLAAERQKMADMQKKMAMLEREKAMHADAAKIPQATARMADGEMVISLPVVNLFTAKNELHAQGKTVLDNVGNFLKKHAIDRIAVRGYTDSTGKAAANQTLSEQRAQKVKEYLVLYQNIPSAKVTVAGLGADQPVASNATDAGRALNRRVEIGVPFGQ
jgi:outer membrane protein OmpA-like peptidoglycan-associated protein